MDQVELPGFYYYIFGESPMTMFSDTTFVTTASEYIGTFATGYRPFRMPTLAEQRRRNPVPTLFHLIERMEVLVNEGNLDAAIDVETKIHELYGFH